jgi:hypothetical protein
MTPEELESELSRKQEWLLVREADASAAEVRCGTARARLNSFGITRMYLVERGKDLTTRRLTLAEAWAEKINAGERDLAAGASELQSLISENNFLDDVFMKTTAGLEPAARIDLLTGTVDFTGAWSDIHSLKADIHRLEVLRAAGPVALLEGGIELKGARSQELDRIAFQAVQDHEQAKAALEPESAMQQERREKGSGPVSWHNPF